MSQNLSRLAPVLDPPVTEESPDWSISKALFIQYRNTRSRKTRDRLVQLNMGLVRQAAHRFAKTCPELLEDLVQVGAIGLIKAVENFKPELGNAFSSFAVPKINSEIQHHLRDRGWSAVKTPRVYLELASKIKRTHARLTKLGREVSIAQVADAMGVNWEEVLQAVSRQPIANLDDLPHLRHEEDNDPDRLLLRSRILSELAKLSPKKQAIVKAHFFDGLDQREIARRQRLEVAEVAIVLNQSLETLRRRLAQ